MTEQIEAFIDAGGQWIAWQYDSRGFPVDLYVGATVNEVVDRVLDEGIE